MSILHSMHGYICYLISYIGHLYSLFSLINEIITNVKIIKENTLVDLNKLYFRLHEAGSLWLRGQTTAK